MTKAISDSWSTNVRSGTMHDLQHSNCGSNGENGGSTVRYQHYPQLALLLAVSNIWGPDVTLTP